MVPPSPVDQSEPVAEANTLDSLEQILQSVNIPTLHIITEQMGDVPQPQVFAATADLEEDTLLSMPLLVSDEGSHTPDLPLEESKEQPHVSPQITEPSVTTQSSIAIKLQSRGRTSKICGSNIRHLSH